MVARALFVPFDEARLHADEQQAVAAARAEGLDHFTVGEAYLGQIARLKPDEAAGQLLKDSPDFQKLLRALRGEPTLGAGVGDRGNCS